MKSTIITPKPLPPERVVLDLTVAEFAVLYLLMWRHLGGSNLLRRSVEQGLHAAKHKLSEENRAKVDKAREPSKSHVYAADAVSGAFSTEAGADD